MKPLFTAILITTSILLSSCAPTMPKPVAHSSVQDYQMAYNYAYAIVPNVYPQFFTPEFAAQTQAKIQQHVTKAADEVSGGDRNHPCYSASVALISKIMAENSSSENFRRVMAANWADHISTDKLQQFYSYYNDPVVQRLNQMKFEKKYISQKEMETSLLASGQFTQADLARLDSLTTRDFYDFTQAQQVYLSATTKQIGINTDASMKATMQTLRSAPSSTTCPLANG